MKLKIVTVFSFLFCSLLLSAQQITVSGTVAEGGTGDPAIGVSVVVKGTANGTVTDINGNYSLSGVSRDATLVFSYIGMTTIEEQVNGRSSVNVTLLEDVQALEEVVVIGYGAARKRDLTGSIATVSAHDIANRPATNPLAAIQGKVSGVQVVNTGRAGQDPEIRIRGTNSITGHLPLYVVDGLFADNINYLNPADIESMEVLKDASSLAIFGVRGANGVIIINTKRAKEGQTLVNVNSSTGFKYVSDRIGLTGADRFKLLYNEQLVNQGAAPFDYTHWQADTDWQDKIFQTAFFTTDNASITGSTDKSRFYLSLGYTREEGSIRNEKLTKYTVNLSSDYNVTDFLRFGYQVNGARSLPPDAKQVASAVRAAPIAPVYGSYTNPGTGETERLYHVLPDFQSAQVNNPMLSVEGQAAHTVATNNRVAGNIYGEVDFLQHFAFKVTLSLDYISNESRGYSPINYVYNPVGGTKDHLNSSESVTQEKMNRTTAQSDMILTYTNHWGDHSLAGTLGFTSNYTESSMIRAGRSQGLNADYPIIDDRDKWWLSIISDGSSATNGGDQWRRSTLSYLARGLYQYRGRYLLNVSFRRDGASVFQNTGNSWNSFYSFGTGWIVSEENFMADQMVIDYLKIRASYGVLGNQNIGETYRYPGYPALSSSGSAVFGDNIITGYGLKYLVSPGLNWEKTYSWEAGFEMNLLANRLRIEPVYYSKETKDMLAVVEGIAGTTPGLANLGAIRNHGFELSASWSDRLRSGLTYSLSGNLTTIDNKVKSLVNKDYAIYGGAGNIARTAEGFPVGYFFGYEVQGVYQNREDIRQSPTNTLASVLPGDLKFRDVNGDGEITAADRTMIGNPTPDLTYGFSLQLGYRDFDFTADFMGVYGNEIYRTWDNNNFAQFNYLTNREKRWHGEGTSNWEPVLNPSRAINYMNSNYFIEDGSFFRLKNIQLGYTFRPELLQKIYVKSLRLHINIQNLKTWSRNTGYTPEIGGSSTAFGIDGGTYPMPAIYTAGVNITF
jgi:TonB-linked SusC/RagA family outer membrane protein